MPDGLVFAKAGTKRISFRVPARLRAGRKAKVKVKASGVDTAGQTSVAATKKTLR